MKSNRELEILELIADRLPLIKDNRLDCIDNIELSDNLKITWKIPNKSYIANIVINTSLITQNNIHLYDLLSDNDILHTLAYDKVKELPEQEQVIIAYIVQLLGFMEAGKAIKSTVIG